MLNNYTKTNAAKYAQHGLENTYYLGFRDIPSLINTHVTGTKAIDYGCGPGRSTRFLNSLGFDTLGVDNSPAMLQEADDINCVAIESAQIPVPDHSYDLIFSSYVFLAISQKSDILAIFKEAARVLKPTGIFLIVTASEHLYSHPWLSYHTDYPENRLLTSGSPAKVRLKEYDIEFSNTYWTDADYQDLFSQSGLKLLKTHHPLGTPEDGFAWVSETTIPPYTIYVLAKTHT